MTNSYQLEKGSIYLSNTSIYTNNKWYEIIWSKIVILAMTLGIGYSAYNYYEDYLIAEKKHNIIYVLLFSLVFLIILFAFIHSWFLATWKAKYDLTNIKHINVEDEDIETDLEIKFNNGKTMSLTFRTLEKEHLRFLDDLKKKKTITVYYNE